MLRNVGVGLVLLVSLAGLVAGAEVKWGSSLDVARKANPERPVLLYFTSDSCGWCRKMETGTFPDAAVQKAAEKFALVKLDVNQADELAARYRIRGVPAFVVLDARGRLLAHQPGYQTASRFARFLDESLTKTPTVDELDVLVDAWAEVVGKPVPQELVEKTITRLSKADRAQRTELLKLLTTRADGVRAPLVELMGHEKLAIRAAAYEALKQGTKLRHPFDPFAPADLRRKQRAAWEMAVAKSGT